MNFGPVYAPVRADEKDRLIKSHLHMVSFLTERMVSQVPAFMTREDIASAAMVGLVDAANRFKPSMGVLFKTFAEKRMRGAVLDEVRRMDWFSRSLRQKQSRVCQAIEDLERRLGRPPEEEEVASSLEMTLDDYRQLLGEVSYLGCVSLHETLEDSPDGPTMLDNIEDQDSPSAMEMLENSELTQELARQIDRLTEKERLVVSLYYYEELSQKEIAEVLELSEGRVSQLHSQALMKLKTSIKRSQTGGTGRSSTAR
ncbi:MAG: polymerase sigma factor FliA [Desulfuromonadales bacterium]|jgi:RNA polymerase sigma factor for flagellar operon FliA|nr:polymerase sigma factor FliA [Desulfuromonadales bacterium]